MNLSVEGHEEDEVLDPGDGKHQGCGHWVIARKYERLECVEEDQDELDELDGRDVLLPPEILLHPGPPGSAEVVKVHHSVDPCTFYFDEC